MKIEELDTTEKTSSSPRAFKSEEPRKVSKGKITEQQPKIQNYLPLLTFLEVLREREAILAYLTRLASMCHHTQFAPNGGRAKLAYPRRHSNEGYSHHEHCPLKHFSMLEQLTNPVSSYEPSRRVERICLSRK